MSEVVYDVKIPNDNDEELELQFSEHAVDLRIRGYAENGKMLSPPQKIILTHVELNHIHRLLEVYKSMLRLKAEAANG